jgi:mannose-6-phosphate isomerase
MQVRDFEALSGFCTSAEISAELISKPELRSCVGERHAAAFTSAASASASSQRAALQAAFTALMTSDSELYQAASQQLYDRLSAAGPSGRSLKDWLFVRVFDQFPGDVGTLAVFFLNYIQLHPGEAVYLAANEPHAYLSGELIEAMASSDNVIRAGLTPKLRDTGVCCLMLQHLAASFQRSVSLASHVRVLLVLSLLHYVLWFQ